MEKIPQGKRMSRQEAEDWRKNWKKSCDNGRKLSSETPPGFLLDRETVEKVLSQGKEVEGLWVSFGRKEDKGEMKLILQAYTGEGEPLESLKSWNGEDEIYDDFGTCCPRKS